MNVPLYILVAAPTTQRRYNMQLRILNASGHTPIEVTSEEIIDLQFFTKDFTQSKLSVIDKNFINSDIDDTPDFFEGLFFDTNFRSFLYNHLSKSSFD